MHRAVISGSGLYAAPDLISNEELVAAYNEYARRFNADNAEDGTLRLTSVCVPRPYAHFRFLTSGGFNNEHQLARHLHSLGGGWEAVAGGMLTLTVPAERASELKRLMYVEGLAPGVLPLEA